MQIEELSEKIQKLYDELGAYFAQAQNASGLHCPPGCGHCCMTPTVEASALEMLPMAFELARRGIADELYQNLCKQIPQTCVMYRKHSEDGRLGSCSSYEQRPSTCRFFGVAALPTKDGSVELSICRELKTLYPQYRQLSPDGLPLMTSASMQLLQLHPELLNERQPISMALRNALERVLLYLSLKNS